MGDSDLMGMVDKVNVYSFFEMQQYVQGTLRKEKLAVSKEICAPAVLFRFFILSL